MTIREAIRRRPWVGIAFAGAAALTAVAAAWSSVRSPRPLVPRIPSEVYFSDDDGKTYFADDSWHVPPYDHAGKEALQAAVFRCPGGRPFVGYLIRYSRAGKAALEAMPDSARIVLSPNVMALRQSTQSVKRPGEKKWYAIDDDRASALGSILAPSCPDGSSDHPEQVLP